MAVLAATGVAYTAWSEFFNVHLVGEWGYAPGMPLLFGIGLTPLLQWVILPPLLVWWSRRPLTQFAALSSAVHPPGPG